MRKYRISSILIIVLLSVISLCVPYQVMAQSDVTEIVVDTSIFVENSYREIGGGYEYVFDETKTINKIIIPAGVTSNASDSSQDGIDIVPIVKKNLVTQTVMSEYDYYYFNATQGVYTIEYKYRTISKSYNLYIGDTQLPVIMWEEVVPTELRINELWGSGIGDMFSVTDEKLGEDNSDKVVITSINIVTPSNVSVEYSGVEDYKFSEIGTYKLVIVVTDGVNSATETKEIIVAYPDAPTEDSLGPVVASASESGIYSDELSFELLSIYNKYYGLMAGSRRTELRQNMFANMDFGYFGGVLDLSNAKISSIEGLQKLNFNQSINLEEVNLSGNNINTITEQSLDTIRNVKKLDISNNPLSNVALTSMENLVVLDASDTNISNIDLSFMKTENEEAIVNLSSTKIESLNNISFRREAMLQNNINLYMLNCLDTDEYEGNSKIKVHTGVMGLQKDKKYVKTDTLMYKKISNLLELNIMSEDIVLKIVDYTNPNIVVREMSNSKVDSVNILDGVAYGKYIMYFVDTSGNSLEEVCSALVSKYNAIEINYVPSVANFVAKAGDEVIDFKSGDLLKQDTVFTFSTTDESAKIYYKLGVGDWVEGNEIRLEKHNTKNLSVKVVCDGVESDIVNIAFATDTSFGLDDLLSIGLVGLALLALFFGLIPLVRYFINKPISVKVKNKKDDEE